MGSFEQERPYASTECENIMPDKETMRLYHVRRRLTLPAIWIRETIKTLEGSAWRNVKRKGNTFVADSARTKITTMHQATIATNGTKLHGQQCQLASRDMKTIKRTFEEYISTPTGFGPAPDSTLDSAAAVAFDSAVVGTMVITFASVAGVAHCIAADIEPALVVVFVLRACCFLILAEDRILL